MINLKYNIEVSKKGQVTIPKTLREVIGIKEESFISMSYNAETDKIEISKPEKKFNEIQVSFLKSVLLNPLPTKKSPVLFISGHVGIGKTTLVKEIVDGLSIDGLKGKVKEHIFSDDGVVYVIDDVFSYSVSDYTNQDKIHHSKPTIITSQREISERNIHVDKERLYIYVTLDNEKRGIIKSIHISQNGQTIEWKW